MGLSPFASPMRTLIFAVVILGFCFVAAQAVFKTEPEAVIGAVTGNEPDRINDRTDGERESAANAANSQSLDEFYEESSSASSDVVFSEFEGVEEPRNAPQGAVPIGQEQRLDGMRRPTQRPIREIQ